ncbi:MAG: type II toxin-antitoxin system RelB/DinJ family antitoxin [Clostridia bacterium]|nr:type II toxin-antitoxin system RelB/DinJ family antitoxin [Clostridia bacterium]
MQSANVAIKTDKNIKEQVKEIYSALGMDLTTAVNIFFRQSIIHHGLPFEVTLDVPNSETAEVFDEVKRMKENPDIGKTYTDVDEMMKELLGDGIT